MFAVYALLNEVLIDLSAYLARFLVEKHRWVWLDGSLNTWDAI